MSKPRRRPVFRDLDGILLLDKPSGLSSNQALQRVRHLLRAAKAGHTGALDPLATGLLPLCFGEATKIAGLLLGAAKAYETVAVLGVATDTLDSDGAVVQTRPVPELTPVDIERALVPLRGRILQTPPVYSALKRDGEPLYARARRGEQVEVEAREVEVRRLELIELAGDRMRLHIECGSGTYVRSLVRDIGEALGCGAHVVELRRTWVEPFRAPCMWTIEGLQDRLQDDASDHAAAALLLPVDAGLTAFPAVRLEPDQARRLGQGQEVPLAGAGALPLCVVQDAAGRALGMGEIDVRGHLHARRLFRWASVPQANDQA